MFHFLICQSSKHVIWLTILLFSSKVFTKSNIKKREVHLDLWLFIIFLNITFYHHVWYIWEIYFIFIECYYSIQIVMSIYDSKINLIIHNLKFCFILTFYFLTCGINFDNFYVHFFLIFLYIYFLYISILTSLSNWVRFYNTLVDSEKRNRKNKNKNKRREII